MKNHNNIKKRNLLLLYYFPFLKMRRTYAIYILEILSEILKRTHEKKRVSQFRRKSDVSRFWWSDQRTNKSIELKNRNLNNFIHFPLHESLLASNKKSTRIWRIMFDRGRGISKPVSRVASRAQKPVKTTRYS